MPNTASVGTAVEAFEGVEVLSPSGHRSILGALGDIARHRDLLYLLARRDVAVRYKQAIFGLAWAVIQPLAMAVAFSLFLNNMAGAAQTGLPYPVYALSGLVPWTFFSNAVGSASESLVASSNLISKVYFPRLAVPTASLLAYLPDFAIASAILGGAMAIYGVAPGWTVVALPVVAVATVAAAFGISVWTSAVNVAYRDVRYAVPFALQLWLFATPVIYSAHLSHGHLQALYGLNPMIGIIEAWRWALIGGTHVAWSTVGVSAGVICAFVASGLRYFQRVERYFADVV